MKFVLIALSTLFIAHICFGQSKPLDLSVTLSDLNNYQALADKGQANGYTPLNSNSLVPPNFLFPGFSSSQDGTIWSKSGSSWLAISNLNIQPFSLVVSLTRVGKLSIPGVSLDIYGVGTELSTVPLTLYGGNNRVYVANGQSIGGANVNFNNFTWSINSSGNFDLNSGIIKGGMSLNNTSISNISSIFSSNGLSINFTNNRITSLQSGKDVIFAGDDFGVQVPNIQTNELLNPLTSETTRNYALNVRSADLLYVAKNSSNNWTLPQRFTGGIYISPALSVSNGGTGATNAAQARQNLGITTGVFQSFSPVLTSLASNVPTTNNFLVGISSAWVSRTPAQVRSILGIEIGSGGLQPYSTALNYISTTVTNNNLGSKYIFVGDPATQTLTARTAALARSDLGLEINSTNGVQAYSPYLRDIANLGIPQLDEFLVGTGTAWTKKVPSQTRISLGLGATWLTNTNVINFRTAIGLGTTSEVTFSTVSSTFVATTSGLDGTSVAPTGIQFNGVAAATTRTNLGLGATWLTNTNVTNFRTAIGLGATNNATFSNITASGTLGVSNTATFATNVTVNGNISVGSLTTTTPSTWALDATQTAAATNGVLALPSNANVIRLTNATAISGVSGGVLGAFYYLVNQTTNAVTISNVGGITVQGGTSLTLGANQAATLVATGATNASVAARGDLTDVALGGTANTAPSQTADSASSLMTRGLSDVRYLGEMWNASKMTAYSTTNPSVTVFINEPMVTYTNLQPQGPFMQEFISAQKYAGKTVKLLAYCRVNSTNGGNVQGSGRVIYLTNTAGGADPNFPLSVGGQSHGTVGVFTNAGTDVFPVATSTNQYLIFTSNVGTIPTNATLIIASFGFNRASTNTTFTNGNLYMQAVEVVVENP